MILPADEFSFNLDKANVHLY
uniref:Uncharacterized protein n=1 Tax=Anguilla anguilla TaxID=7936 RepID=A0A0E9UBD0_ANGAN